jgi:hypothetical protein
LQVREVVVLQARARASFLLVDFEHDAAGTGDGRGRDVHHGGHFRGAHSAAQQELLGALARDRLAVELELLALRQRRARVSLDAEQACRHVVWALVDGLGYAVQELGCGAFRSQLDERVGQAAASEQLICDPGLGDAVRVEADLGTAGQRHDGLPGPRRHPDADRGRGAGGHRRECRAVGAQHDRRGVSRARVDENAGARVVGGGDDGHEEAAELALQHRARRLNGSARRQPGLEVGAQREAHESSVR